MFRLEYKSVHSGVSEEKRKIMMLSVNEKSLRALAMLRYQADRYQAMGNGSMCQLVNAEIRRLTNEMNTLVKD